MSIWVCGEVLIDILPTGPVVGGGPANTAKALARLGHDVDFIDGISTDAYGVSARKARVVLATGNSTMYERVLAEEQGIDWYATKGLPEETHAIHGGGLPLNVKGMGCVGILLISGLPQVQDHLLGVEVLTEFLARKGELL